MAIFCQKIAFLTKNSLLKMPRSKSLWLDVVNIDFFMFTPQKLVLNTQLKNTTQFHVLFNLQNQQQKICVSMFDVVGFLERIITHCEL